MYDWLIDMLLSRPTRIVNIGRAFLRTGMFLVFAGLMCHVAIVGISAIKGLGGNAPVVLALSDLYLTAPTWWIPESFAGYAISIGLAITGFLVMQIGREVMRAL